MENIVKSIPLLASFTLTLLGTHAQADEQMQEGAVAGAECNTVIELKWAHRAA